MFTLVDAQLGGRQILVFGHAAGGSPILPPALLMRSTHSLGTLLEPCMTMRKAGQHLLDRFDAVEVQPLLAA